MTRFIPPLAILAGAVALLQAHSIQFWMEWVGPMGWAWSLLLEAVALWLWWQPGAGTRALGLVASLLLLAGPLHQVTAPIAEAGRTDTARAETVGTLRAEIAQLEQSLGTFLDNSASRTGWAGRIDRTQQDLAAARERLRRELQQSAGAAVSWQRLAVVAMQAIALVLFQVTAVMALTRLAGEHRRLREPRPETSPQPRKQPPETLETAPTDGETRVETINRRLDEELQRTGLSQRAWGEQYGFKPRDLSLVRNHARLQQEGKRTAPAAVLDKLQALLAV